MRATWIAGPTGVAVLLLCGLVVAIERTKKRKKERIGAFGWIGLGCATVAGLGLTATLALFLAGLDEVSSTVGIFTVVPTVLGIGCLGSEWTKHVPGGGDINDSVTMMNDIARHHQ